MSLNHINLSIPLQQKIKRAGYETIEKLLSLDILDITTGNELQLNQLEREQLSKAIDKERDEIEVKHQNEQLNSISTQSNNIDLLFGFGIPPKKITEICGESGTGKTQLCMQIGVNSLAKGECIYIDTEGSCSLNGRLKDILTTQNIDRLHLFHVLSHAELMSIITQLPDMLEDFPNTKLIIIDSLAFHFRVNVLTKAVRDGLLNEIGITLTNIAREKNLAVAVVNHVTQEGEDSDWIPSLGPAWGNWCSSRLFLFRKRSSRFAYLYRLSDATLNRPVQFCIKEHGISDPIKDEIEIINDEQTQRQLDNNIEYVFTQLKQEKDAADEQNRVDEFWSGAYSDKPYVSKITSHQDHAEIVQNNVTPTQYNEHDCPNPSQSSHKTEATVESIPCTQVVNEETFIPATQIPAAYEDEDFIPATQLVENANATKGSRVCTNIQPDQEQEDSLGDYKEDALSWDGHEGNLPDTDSQVFSRVSPSNSDIGYVPKKPHIKPIFKDPLPIREKLHTYTKAHGPEHLPIYEDEGEALFDIKGLETNEDVNSSQQDKSSIIFSEDELICSSQDISNAYNSDDQLINSTQSKPNINYADDIRIYSTQDTLKSNEPEENETILSTQDKLNVDNSYPNHEIVYSTQGKSVIHETDSEGYLYSTQDKSILRKMYLDVETSSQSNVEDFENASHKAELPMNQNDKPSKLDDETDMNIPLMSSLSSLSSQEKDVEPDRKKAIKRDHSAVDSKNTSCESLSSSQHPRKRSKGNVVRFQIPENSSNESCNRSPAGVIDNSKAASEVAVKSNNESADWDSDEEEQLDYKYIEEMDEYL
ncbi:uncharacterized protein EV154DRAFT_565659 [Mucor mucedo]|uniref:uncharacterized protein n=1 Tax=Mucor mucedo TaxID=29922 RepID=UPI002220F445|nr:uncharacterized protein EV154DRAFT_565659 [Mucor mucedo]KAI7889138.1 hypothetical protein EV154DRAFT_565659 [Mucor mucedo]